MGFADPDQTTKFGSERSNASGSGEDTFFDSQAWLESPSEDDLHSVYDEPLSSCATSPNHETRTSISSSDLSSMDNNDINTCHSRHESSSCEEESEDHFWGDNVVGKQTSVELVPDYYNTSKERKLYELSEDRFWSDNKIATTSCSIGDSHPTFFNLPLPIAENEAPDDLNKSSQARLEQDKNVTGVKSSSRCCSCFSF